MSIYDLSYHPCILKFSCCGATSISCSQQLSIKDWIFQRASYSSSIIDSSHINLLLNISPSLSDQHSYGVNQWWPQEVALTCYVTHSYDHHQQLWEFQVARDWIQSIIKQHDTDTCHTHNMVFNIINTILVWNRKVVTYAAHFLTIPLLRKWILRRRNIVRI